MISYKICHKHPCHEVMPTQMVRAEHPNIQLYLNAQKSVKGAMLSSDNSIGKGKIKL